MATTTAATADSSRQLLRHTLATVAYRGGKTLREAPESFAQFKIAEKSRTPEQVLAHIGDLYDWALALCRGKHEWHNSAPLPWEQEVQRFFRHSKILMSIWVLISRWGFPRNSFSRGRL